MKRQIVVLVLAALGLAACGPTEATSSPSSPLSAGSSSLSSSSEGEDVPSSEEGGEGSLSSSSCLIGSSSSSASSSSSSSSGSSTGSDIEPEPVVLTAENILAAIAGETAFVGKATTNTRSSGSETWDDEPSVDGLRLFYSPTEFYYRETDDPALGIEGETLNEIHLYKNAEGLTVERKLTKENTVAETISYDDIADYLNPFAQLEATDLTLGDGAYCFDLSGDEARGEYMANAIHPESYDEPIMKGEISFDADANVTSIELTGAIYEGGYGDQQVVYSLTLASYDDIAVPVVETLPGYEGSEKLLATFESLKEGNYTAVYEFTPAAPTSYSYPVSFTLERSSGSLFIDKDETVSETTTNTKEGYLELAGGG